MINDAMMKEDQPFISIITVCYNSVDTIERAIKSVLQQNYRNVEYIIVDGGSEDGTLSIIKKYFSESKGKIRYVSEKDSGIYDAMNKGLMMTTGQVVGFLGSDDRYFDGALKTIAEYYKKTKANVLYGDVVIYDNGELEHRSYSNIDLDRLFYEMILCHQGIFIERELHLRHLFDTNYRISADYKVLLELILEKRKYQYVPINIAIYNRGGTSFIENKTAIYEQCKIAYTLLSQHEKLFSIYRERIENRYYFERFKENRKEVIDRGLVKKCLIDFGLENNQVVVFGAGIDGMDCIHLLEESDIKVDFVIDNNVTNLEIGYQVKKPFKLSNKVKYFFVIASSKYGKEMKNELSNISLHKECKVIFFRQIIIYAERRLGNELCL